MERRRDDEISKRINGERSRHIQGKGLRDEDSVQISSQG